MLLAFRDIWGVLQKKYMILLHTLLVLGVCLLVLQLM